MPSARMLRRLFWIHWLLLATLPAAWSAEAPSVRDEKPATPPADAPAGDMAAEKSIEELAESARKSVVVISITGRDGKQQGLGTGFVIAPDGLIATNLHVIGEGRSISVQTADGKQHAVTSIHATQRASDLALIRIDAKDLPPLELGDSDTLRQGQAVVAIGNPHGLQYSVVSGVVSGTREIEGRSMIQLAIPIEAGNSGGPLLDMQGRVHGIITMKSLVTRNLGFAVASNALRPLIERPNPIPMDRWLTIGALDPNEWTTLFGARWRQRAGRILVDGLGRGFGGRSLCLWEAALPELPFEVAVQLKLEEEDGAAGLVYHSDGGERHYGFYPSGGKLRLSRFDGADVFSWQVLEEKPSEHYRPGEWNTLKVRLEKDRVLCYVNDQLVIESHNTSLPSGKVGLAKFRDTRAEFKNFQVAKEISSSQPDPKRVAAIEALVEKVPLSGSPREELVSSLLPHSSDSLIVLRERAKRLEQEAAQLRQLALAVHHQRVRNELSQILSAAEEDVNLLRAALLIALIDNDELDVEAYEKQVDRMAREIAATFPADADEAAKIDVLNKALFEERGFHGSHGDYDNRSNSYLNEVLDDREGLPITLSVLYIELARRLDLNVVGIGLPGHFVVQHRPEKGEPQLIDVFEGGVKMSREDAERKVLGTSGRPLREEHLTPVSKRQIITRMLHNLMGLAQESEDIPGMLRYVETIVAVNPEAAQERWFRAVLRFQTGEHHGAADDVDWLLERNPEGIDLGRVRELSRLLNRTEPR